MMMEKHIFRLIVIGSICLIPALAYPQQQVPDVKFRLAQSYERSGNYETATKLYEELYIKDSSNYLVFDALKRMYVQLKRYESALMMIQRRIALTPNDIGLHAQLGTVYIRASDEKNATAAWERGIAVAPHDEFTYRMIADAMVENRMFDQVVVLYQRGRKECGNPSLFTMELAYIYSIMLNYKDATREYLALIRENPGQLPFAQSRIASYANRSDGLEAATLMVEEGVKNDAGNITFLQLVAWLYMEGKRFESAYSIYKTIDEKRRAAGKDIYFFADRALREKAYAIAAKAFRDIISNYPSFPQLPQAKFGYARTLEEASKERDSIPPLSIGYQSPPADKPASESEPTYSATLAAYNRVVAEYPSSDVAAQSLLRIAILQQERYFNLDEALATLERIQKSYGMVLSVTLEAKLRLGDVYLSLNRVEKAEATYKSLIDFKPVNKEYRERASLRLAELHYFRGRFQDALTQLRDLTKEPTANITNDALALQIFIQENLQPSDSALKVYSQAELLRRQRKLSEALGIYQTIPTTFPSSPLVDETLMNIGEIFAHMKRYTDAVAANERIINEFTSSIMTDKAYINIGTIYQFGLNDRIKAIMAYQTLLEKYPNSIYINEARKRIREMRGDSL